MKPSDLDVKTAMRSHEYESKIDKITGRLVGDLESKGLLRVRLKRLAF